MPTNANTFNSRVTSEALEAKFRQVFPAQGGAELVQDLFASGVIQPVVDFSTVAEGSVLAPDLQTAWDFSTGFATVNDTSTTIVSNTGFWKVDLIGLTRAETNTIKDMMSLSISNGLTSKKIWGISSNDLNTIADVETQTNGSFVVFLRAGDSLIARSGDDSAVLSVWYRQIADVNGNLVNPLGFTFS